MHTMDIPRNAVLLLMIEVLKVQEGEQVNIIVAHVGSNIEKAEGELFIALS